MSVKLARPAISPTDRPIPWTSSARFIEIGREGQMSGTLRSCIAAYRELAPDRRGMAMIITDVLVPACQGLPAVRKLEPRDMDCLVEAFHAEAQGRDPDEADDDAPVVIDAGGPAG